jgi:hypothetical protein
MLGLASTQESAQGARAKTLERLLSRYQAVPGGCHEWTGSTNGKGYGVILLGMDGRKRLFLAHRLQWMRYHGKIPDGLVIMHACDNQRCINVEHLQAGTQLENMHDMLAKGRQNYSGLKNVGASAQNPAQSPNPPGTVREMEMSDDDSSTAGAVSARTGSGEGLATPWRAEYDGGYVVLDAEGDLVAIGMATAAQTHVIAAAPDLLAALEAMIDGVMRADAETVRATPWMARMTRNKLDAARAAVAKAKGADIAGAEQGFALHSAKEHPSEGGKNAE